jgi:hypothetical protein
MMTLVRFIAIGASSASAAVNLSATESEDAVQVQQILNRESRSGDLSGDRFADESKSAAKGVLQKESQTGTLSAGEGDAQAEGIVNAESQRSVELAANGEFVVLGESESLEGTILSEEDARKHLETVRRSAAK